MFLWSYGLLRRKKWGDSGNCGLDTSLSAISTRASAVLKKHHAKEHTQKAQKKTYIDLIQVNHPSKRGNMIVWELVWTHRNQYFPRSCPIFTTSAITGLFDTFRSAKPKQGIVWLSAAVATSSAEAASVAPRSKEPPHGIKTCSGMCKPWQWVNLTEMVTMNANSF